MKGAAIQLKAMLRENPNLCVDKSLRAIGADLGVSGERVRQLLPRLAKSRTEIRRQNRLAERSRRLAAYVDTNPLALLAKTRGGPSMTEIAEATGLSEHNLREVWQLCGYPSKRATGIYSTLTSAEINHYQYERNKETHKRCAASWAARNPEKVREIARRACRKYYAKKKAEREATA